MKRAAAVALLAALLTAGCGPRTPEESAVYACGKGKVAWVNAENPEAYGCKDAGVEFPNGANN